MLNGTPAIVSSISGKIYTGDDGRPMNSVKEDIVVNTISLTQNYDPQIGTSNINIHVPDKIVSISGVQQNVQDKTRLKTITALVLDAVRSTKVSGLTIMVESQNTVPEPEIKQHFSNIRISWNIHN
jgi:hypothetical protein